MKVVLLNIIHHCCACFMSLLCVAINILSGACMCVCSQIIGTFPAVPWADSVSGAVLVLGSTECLSAGFLLCPVSGARRAL